MSHMLERMFQALSTSELSTLRADNARLCRERDTYLESLQHVQARADRLAEKNRELVRLLPVALTADAFLKCVGEFFANQVNSQCLCGACTEHMAALDSAVDAVQDLVRTERDRRHAARPGGTP